MEGFRVLHEIRGVGFTWSHSNAQRGYRVRVEYGKYRYLQSGCAGTYYYRWKPRYETGGTSTYTSTRPNWTKCENVSSGTWWRSRSDGYSYTLGTGVKIKSVIGFDLSVKRGYSSNHKISYKISGSPKKMCGNAGHWPAIAGKQMEKYR